MDTELILSHIDRRFCELRELIIERTARNKPRKKANPTKKEVLDYAAERGRIDLADAFFDHYTGAEWCKADGTPVVNWKGTFNTWCSKHPAPNKLFNLGEIG